MAGVGGKNPNFACTGNVKSYVSWGKGYRFPEFGGLESHPVSLYNPHGRANDSSFPRKNV